MCRGSLSDRLQMDGQDLFKFRMGSSDHFGNGCHHDLGGGLSVVCRKKKLPLKSFTEAPQKAATGTASPGPKKQNGTVSAAKFCETKGTNKQLFGCRLERPPKGACGCSAFCSQNWLPDRPTRWIDRVILSYCSGRS